MGWNHWVRARKATPAAAAMRTQGERGQGFHHDHDADHCLRYYHHHHHSKHHSSLTLSSPSQGAEPYQREVQQLPAHHHLHQQAVCLG